MVRKQSGSNSVKLIDRVKARLAELQASLPADFQVTVIRDQSRFIRRNLHEVSFHMLLGMVLVALTVFLFMHDWRGTVIASISIPASLVATFTLMKVMRFSLNNSTMLGLTFAVGVVIDDAIVVLENVHRIMEEKGLSAVDAAIAGTREIALAVMATTLSLVVIFLPLAFMKGRTGMFFSSYGMTVAFAIMVSLFVSLTLTPMLASRFLRHTTDARLREKKAHGGRLMRLLGEWYGTLLLWSLRHRWLVMTICAGFVVSVWPMLKASRFTFMPQDDSSEFEIAMTLPEGTSLERSAAIVATVERDLHAIQFNGRPAFTDILVTIGPSSGRSGKGEGGRNRC